MGLKKCMGDNTHTVGTTNTPSFRQNPRGDPKFLTWIDPMA